MASVSKTPTALTLVEFLSRRDLDEKPYPEFIDGRIEPKMSPRIRHSLIQAELASVIRSFARPHRLGLAFVELRCSYANRSILPDVTFLSRDHLLFNADGELSDELFRGTPDLHVEIVSPDQSIRDQRERLIHSTSYGASLGWLIDPYRKRVEVIRPGGAIETLDESGVLSGDPVLPGFALPVAEIWAWLRPGR